MIIRPATFQDLGQGMIMFRRFHAEGILRVFTINEEKTKRWLGGLIGKGRIIVAEEGRTLIGAAAVDAASYPFSDDVYMSEQFIYVLPEHRCSGAGIALIRSMIAYAKRSQMLVFAGVSTGTDVERKDALFRRIGLQRIGGMYTSARI